MEPILLAYSLLKETITTVRMLFKNTIAIARSPDGNINFLHIFADDLQGDTLTPYLFIICLDDVLRMSIDLRRK